MVPAVTADAITGINITLLKNPPVLFCILYARNAAKTNESIVCAGTVINTYKSVFFAASAT